MVKKSWVTRKPVDDVAAEVKAAIERVLEEVKFPIEDNHNWKDYVFDVIELLHRNYKRWDTFKDHMHTMKNPVYSFIYHTVRNSINSMAATAEQEGEHEEQPEDDAGDTLSDPNEEQE